VIAHVSYDRIFQTPSFENILLSSSPQVQSFEPTVLRLPVEPSKGNYSEAGVTKSFFGQLRLDANILRREVNNYADDNQILNTSVSFPIAFRKAIIYGAEGKLGIPDWRRFSGFVSCSYEVGNAWFPVTGGLFLREDAIDATAQRSLLTEYELASHTLEALPDFGSNRPHDAFDNLLHRCGLRPLSRSAAGAGLESGHGGLSQID